MNLLLIIGIIIMMGEGIFWVKGYIKEDTSPNIRVIIALIGLLSIICFSLLINTVFVYPMVLILSEIEYQF